MSDRNEERFRILGQTPYTFIYVDTYWSKKRKGHLPTGINEAMADLNDIWQMTVPVRENPNNWYTERWSLGGVHHTGYLDFHYSEEEKNLLNGNLLRVKREEHFRRHIKFRCRIFLESLYLPSDVYKSIKEKAMNEEEEDICFDCDGGANDRHRFEFDEDIPYDHRDSI